MQLITKFGICVTFVILLNGCTGIRPEPMTFAELQHYKVDCRIKFEQDAYLKSKYYFNMPSNHSYMLDQIRTEIQKCR